VRASDHLGLAFIEPAAPPAAIKAPRSICFGAITLVKVGASAARAQRPGRVSFVLRNRATSLPTG
jgi:hypothetical protein